MNEGPTATRLGLAGIPAAAETVMVQRDCELAELTGGRVHFAHLSCAGALDALREGKRRGLRVSGESCPHYWTLTDEAVARHGADAKMNPPLRSARDREAVITAIADGTLDCLTTDHAPHEAEEKRQTVDRAPFGIVGLETALALTLTFLVEPGHITLARAIELWTEAPRRLFGLPVVSLEPGDPADLVLFDPDALPLPGPEHAVRGLKRERPGAAHGVRRRDHAPGAGRARRRCTGRSRGGRAMKRRPPAILALEDGRVFKGESFGARAETTGEVVFNTAMTGYQEVMTDPSYFGQIVTFTYPLIGNYGINAEDFESVEIRAQAMVCREVCERPSSWRATGKLQDWLENAGVPALAGIDTRALTRHLRDHGVMRGCLSAVDLAPDSLVEKARKSPSMLGLALADLVTWARTAPPRPVPSPIPRRACLPARSRWCSTTASSGTSCAASTPRASGCACCPRALRRAKSWRSSPTGSCSRTAPATPSRSPSRSPPRASWSSGCRCSASASATSCWGSPRAAGRASSSSATAASTTPSWTGGAARSR